MVFSKTKQQLKLVTAFILLLFLGIAYANAAAGLNVVLANQNPDPVSPGNYVYLNVKVSNVGSEIINDVRIKFNENDYFRIAPGELNQRELGIFSGFSTSDNSKSFVVVRYKVYVDSKTPTGINNINFDLETSAGTYNYDFDVLVQDSNPQLTIENLDISEISPGSEGKLKLILENKNNIELKNIKVALDLANVENRIITTAKGSNEYLVGEMNFGESSTVEYDLLVSPSAESKPYLIPIIVTYEDNLDNSFVNTLYASLKVYSKPDLSVSLYSQEIYTQGKGKITLSVANPGTSKIKGVQFVILPSDDYEIVEGENQYVGDLNPDDFQTLQSTLFIKNTESVNLKVKLVYGDSYDTRTEKVIEMPLKIYNNEQLVEYGFAPAKNVGGGMTSYIIIALLSSVITFFFVRRSFKKKIARKNC